MKDVILIVDNKRVEAVPIDDILRLESDGACTIIHCKNRKRFVYSKHLKIILSEPDPKLFFRVHKSQVVNLKEIKFYEKGRGGNLIMSDESIVPLAQRKKAEFLKRFCT